MTLQNRGHFRAFAIAYGDANGFDDCAVVVEKGRVGTGANPLQLANFVELNHLKNPPLDFWRDHAANVDAAFEDIHSDLIAMQDLHNRMLQLGSNFPSHQQFKVLGLLALKTALMGTPIWAREFDHLPPNQRHKFKDLVSGWADSIELGIAARLGEDKQKKVA
ncbi:hypothetical protein [Bradyrhizobium sp.]|uniref:hypothetical protein n=1 Tax=Bradyrhizobium sp. TaxID=376 RepID=UPI003BAF656B